MSIAMVGIAAPAVGRGVRNMRLPRETVRECIEQMGGFFSAHGRIDPAEAHHRAVIAIGNIVYKQSLITGFSDTFAVLGILPRPPAGQNS
jgi:MFS transporter, DHA2 family, multidrug resistance protein